MGRTTRTAAERKAQAEALQATILTQVQALTSEDSWKAYLKFIQSFHSYSLNNVLLILSQHPEATQVAGFRKWQQLGRQVRKGEKSIRIFGYSQKIVRDNDGNEVLDGDGDVCKRTIYPVLSVFDISQTDEISGITQPDDHTHQLSGADTADLWEPLTSWISEQGWTVSREKITGATNGYTTTDGSRRIVIDETLPAAHATKTLIHEAAHMLLHTDLEPGEYVEHRGTCETEAESVAYAVAGAYGMDTADYTIGYVAGWSEGEEEIIKATAANVLKAAHRIIDGVETRETIELPEAAQPRPAR